MNTPMSNCEVLDQHQGGGALSRVISRVWGAFRGSSLASRGVLSIFDQAVYSGTSFLTAALIGRLTSPEQLGLYYLVLSVVLIISGVQENLVAAPYSVYSKRRQGRELAEYAGSMWVHYGAVTLIAMIGLAIAVPVLSVEGQARIVPGLWAVIAFCPMLMFRQWIRRYTFASASLKSAVALDVTVAVFQLAGLGLLGYYGLLSLFRIFLVIGSACGLACIVWYLIERPRLQFVRERCLSDWRHNWGFSKWALQTYVLGNTTPQLMLWIVSLTIGATATGLFGACNNLIGMTYVILSGVDNVLTPQAAHSFAAGGVRELRRTLLLVGAFVVAALGAFVALFLVTGDWLVVAAFGHQYQGTDTILVALAASTLMNGLSIVAGNGLWAIDQPRLNFFADVCCMAVTLLAAALFIHPFGALGAALATLAGTSIAAIARIVTLIRSLESDAVKLYIPEPSVIST